MAIIDLSLTSFLIPNFNNYVPSFGTKKIGEKQGLTSMETHLNIAMGFQRQRPVVVSENSETTTIESDSMVVFDGAITELRLGAASFTGCRLVLINNAGHKVTLLDGANVTYSYPGRMMELYWVGTWAPMEKSRVGNVVSTMISDETILAQHRYLLLKGQTEPILPLYDELVDTIWRGASTNDIVSTFYRCDEDGTRNAEGEYFKFPNAQGRVMRGAGQGDQIFDKDNVPITGAYYQGGSNGDAINDAIRNIWGGVKDFMKGFDELGTGAFGYFKGDTTNRNWSGISGDNVRQFDFSADRVVPVANWNRDASISAGICLIY